MINSARHFETGLGSFENGSQSIAVPTVSGSRILTDTLSPESMRPLKSARYLEVVSSIGTMLMGQAATLDRPLLVGVNGVDTAGKTEFTRTMADYLVSVGFPHVVVHVDDFMNSYADRHAGASDVDNYYNHMIDFASLMQGILRPVHEGQTPDVTFQHAHPADDGAKLVHSYHVPPSPSIVLTEGVLLFRREFRNEFDSRIFLHASLEEVYARVRKRDIAWGGEEVVEEYASKYLPAQMMYFNHVNPMAHAHMIVDNTDVQNPILTLPRREDKL